ncbi:MAG: nucleotidyltransferase domain-containing protein [Desulfococcaceae bacterium]|jgi:predicted nucleotidyltransferase|nr:nucleotidyltransferase domain-containing protein [Desulfococcaceae bacterium]
MKKDSMEIYRETAFRRMETEKKLLKKRFEQAWGTARKAANLLRQRASVSKVAVFGSLVRENLFHPGSDIDLAVWGLDEKLYFRSVAWLMEERDFDIDLVRMEDAKESLRKTVQSEGVLI